MPIAGLGAALVRDLYLLAVAAMPAGADHAAISGRDNRGASSRRKVHALVEAHVSEDRMEAFTKARGQSTVHRQAEPRAVLSADPFGIQPDEVFAVGPFKKLDVGARSSIEARCCQKRGGGMERDGSD